MWCASKTTLDCGTQRVLCQFWGKSAHIQGSVSCIHVDQLSLILHSLTTCSQCAPPVTMIWTAWPAAPTAQPASRARSRWRRPTRRWRHASRATRCAPGRPRPPPATWPATAVSGPPGGVGGGVGGGGRAKGNSVPSLSTKKRHTPIFYTAGG